MGEIQKKKTSTIVLMGRTGNGKSATANSIVGSNEFVSKSSGKSVTQKCQLKSIVWKDGDRRTLNVVDTPGLFDTDADQRFVAKEIVNCIQLAKDGLHGVLLVTSLRNRFTEEEAGVLDCLQILFGPKITNYMVVVFTGGDELENNEMTLEEYMEDCPKTLKDLIRRCNNRVVVFNNKTKCKTKKTEQVTELLKQIDNIDVENGGQPFSDELFTKFQARKREFFGQQEDMSQKFAEALAMVEKKMETIVAKLREQLASEKNARINADNSVKKLKEEIDKLKKEQNEKACPEPPTKPPPGGKCRIL